MVFGYHCNDAIWIEGNIVADCGYVSPLSGLCTSYYFDNDFVEGKTSCEWQICIAVSDNYVGYGNRLCAGMLRKSGYCCENLKKVLKIHFDSIAFIFGSQYNKVYPINGILWRKGKGTG